MSTNPLDKLQNIDVKYVLAAFAYTEDACHTKITPSLGSIGTRFSGESCGGPAVVIVNEFKDPSYAIDLFETEFNYYSALAPTSTQMLGQIRISDRIGGRFPTFLKKCSEELGVSQTHMAFSLVVYFSGYLNVNGASIKEVIATKPFIFNMGTLVQTFTGGTNNYYSMMVMATYNTFGLMPTFSKMYQQSITNVNGNPSQEVPKPDLPLAQILPRGVEDSLKEPLRKDRIDKSKPMETLGDAYDSLAEDLMQQKYEHQRQLQEWQSFIRDDYVKKIQKPVQIKPGGIPVDYRLTLEDGLRDYKIDNRNLPFEQPEQNQEKYGVRTIPVFLGEHLINFVSRMMKYSRQLSEEAKRKPRKSFKSVITIIRRCQGKYDAFLKTSQILLPTNNPSGSDTGPDKAVQPLVLEYQRSGTDDSQVLSVSGSSASLIDYSILEKQIDDPDAEVVYGNREQVTAERTSQVDFFNSLFSGIRPSINVRHNAGLESGEDAGYFDTHLMGNINAQPNQFTITMRCDPNLMSDLFRNPWDVVFGDGQDCVYYSRPEIHPMYMILKVYLDPLRAAHGLREDEIPANTHYHLKYYHISKVKTIITDTGYNHEITLLREDDTT